MSAQGVVSWPGGVLAVMDADGRALEGYLATLKWDHRLKWAEQPAKHDEARSVVAELFAAARLAVELDRVTDGLRDAVARAGRAK